MNKYKKKLLLHSTIILGSIGAIIHSGNYLINEYQRHKEIQKDQRTLDSLIVNLDDNIRTKVSADEKTGFKQLRKLTTKSAYEDSWCYIPQENMWIETGIESEVKRTKDTYISTVGIHSDFLYTLVKEYGELLDVHIHPDSELIEKQALSQKIESRDGLYKPKGSKAKREFEYTNQVLKRIFIKSYGSKPSDNDFVSMIQQTIRSLKRNPNINFKSALCSRDGVTKYYLTKIGQERYKDEKIDILLTKDYELIELQDGFKIVDKYIHIEYTPFEDKIKTHQELAMP
ncbi:hypothetical protein KY321_00775 [Candidatus Woesearchaeota archaeon]|nr:hypothetical protein [Candidatus Woesearchaeota archaeon]